ncbi:MAG: energy transducer TonB [Burkholderiales bacterium]|jgi:protein TonB
MHPFFERPRQVALAINQRIDARLDAVAALPPPPVAISIQRAIALSIPMQTAAAISLSLHLFMVVGIGFTLIDAQRFAPPHNVMDVVLVNSKSDTRPLSADALAQANLDGGGNTDERRRAKTPLPAMEQAAAPNEMQAAQERVRQLEAEMKALMVQAKAAAKINPNQATPAGSPDPVSPSDLMKKSIEIEKLEAELSKAYDAYQTRPKRKFIGARTAEYRFAQYVDNWRLKIEHVGNLNYPEEAKTRGIHGQLQLTVAIKANGEVESIEINRSSGKRVLDNAAKRIVQLAAPYDKFPDNIRRDTDVIHITRTWMFIKGDTFETK